MDRKSRQALESMVEQRIRTWEAMSYQEPRTSRIPTRPRYWRWIWVGAMAAFGAGLERWGDWILRQVDTVSASIGGEPVHNVEPATQEISRSN